MRGARVCDMSISRATLLAALLVLAVSGQVSLVSAQDAEGLNVTDAPKILFSTAGFLNVVPEDDWEAFQADFAAELESLSDGAIDQGNVTLSRFTVTADNRTTMDMEIYFTDAEDAFAAKNLLTTPQIGLQFQELGLGPALFLDVTVHEASDVNSGEETLIAGILGALLGCVVLLCISNLAIALCICVRRRGRKASAGPEAAPSKSPAPKPSKDGEKPEKKKRFSFGRGAKSTEDKPGPSTDEEKAGEEKAGRSFSFGMRSKSKEKSPEKPAVAKRGWFGRKKYQGEPIADEEAPATPNLASAAEADGLAPSHDDTPEPETGGDATSP